MNVKAVRWAWKQPIENDKRRLVLLALAILANNMGAVSSSQNRLMKETGFARSTLIQHLNALVYDGYIRRVQNYRKNGRRAVNTYYLAYGGTFQHLPADRKSKELNDLVFGITEDDDGVW